MNAHMQPEISGCVSKESGFSSEKPFLVPYFERRFTLLMLGQGSKDFKITVESGGLIGCCEVSQYVY